MIFPGCEVNTNVTCLQVIAKKEVIAKIGGAPCPPLPPKSASAPVHLPLLILPP